MCSHPEHRKDNEEPVSWLNDNEPVSWLKLTCWPCFRNQEKKRNQINFRSQSYWPLRIMCYYQTNLQGLLPKCVSLPAASPGWLQVTSWERVQRENITWVCATPLQWVTLCLKHPLTIHKCTSLRQTLKKSWRNTMHSKSLKKPRILKEPVNSASFLRKNFSACIQRELSRLYFQELGGVQDL